jgi:hypothetical protein
MLTVLPPRPPDGDIISSDFILNDRSSNGSTIFDDNASCTCGRDPSLVRIESEEVAEKLVQVLSTVRVAC